MYGMACINAARDVRAGGDFASALSTAKNTLSRMRGWLAVPSLKYLAQSGRVSKVLSTLGTLLSIKVILKIGEGEVVLVDKYRTSSMAFEKLRDNVLAVCQEGAETLCLVHADNLEEAHKARRDCAFVVGMRRSDLYGHRPHRRSTHRPRASRRSRSAKIETALQICYSRGCINEALASAYYRYCPAVGNSQRRFGQAHANRREHLEARLRKQVLFHIRLEAWAWRFPCLSGDQAGCNGRDHRRPVPGSPYRQHQRGSIPAAGRKPGLERAMGKRRQYRI